MKWKWKMVYVWYFLWIIGKRDWISNSTIKVYYIATISTPNVICLIQVARISGWTAGEGFVTILLAKFYDSILLLTTKPQPQS